MESQFVAPHHGHAPAHEVDPHSAGLRTEGEEKHHDDKPTVMGKVKERVKKIKNKIDKMKHDGGRNRESDTNSDEEVEEEENGYKEDDDLEVISAPTSEPQRVSLGDAEKFEPEKVRLGDEIGDVKEDPTAPKSTTPPAIGGEEIGMTPVIQSFESISVSNEPKPELDTKTESQPSGGEEIGMTPVIQSFEPISVSNEPKPELDTKTESQPSGATGSTDHPNVSYTEKLKSMATVPAEYGKNIASTVYDTLSNAGTVVVQKIRGGPAKEVDTETNREVNQEKGVSVKEYMSEKLKPGEEDQALSEVISESMQRRKEEIKATEEVATAQTKAGGVRMVEKIRGAVTSVVRGNKGSDNTTVASDLHQEKGSHEAAAEPRMLE